MEKKTLKQSLRDIFSFNWLKKGSRKASGSSSEPSRRVPRSNYYRSSYYRQNSFWRRNKQVLQVGAVVLAALLMATCAGIDFIWKGDIGTGKGRVVDLYKSYDSTDSDYDYYASISWSGGSTTESMTRGTWNRLHEGQECTVYYVVGGITGLTWVYDVNYH